MSAVIPSPPIHLRGFRAFPAETRIRIWSQYILDVTKETFINSGRTPALLIALTEDQELYDEVFELFLEHGTIRFIGSRNPVYPPMTEHELDQASMLMVRKMSIVFLYSSEAETSPSLQFLISTNAVSQFPNIAELVLDFTQFFAPAVDQECMDLVGISYCEMVGTLVKMMQGLKKISVIMSGKPKVLRVREIQDQGLTSDAWFSGDSDRVREIQDQGLTSDAWFTGDSDPQLTTFENSHIVQIWRHLGINPKMAHVPTVEDRETELNEEVYELFDLVAQNPHLLHHPGFADNLLMPYQFEVDYKRQVIPSIKTPDVTWFWEAAEGSTLAFTNLWLDAHTHDIQGGFTRLEGNTQYVDWNAMPGEAIVWKEELVSRSSTGHITFLKV